MATVKLPDLTPRGMKKDFLEDGMYPIRNCYVIRNRKGEYLRGNSHKQSKYKMTKLFWQARLFTVRAQACVSAEVNKNKLNDDTLYVCSCTVRLNVA